MKRLIVSLILIVGLLCAHSFAADTPDTLLSAVTATGSGTAVDIGKPYPLFTCAVTWGGTAPTNTVVALEGSIDGTTYAALQTVTVTATGTIFHVADKPVMYYRGNYVSKSGGDATTAVTMKCVKAGRF